MKQFDPENPEKPVEFEAFDLNESLKEQEKYR